MGNTWTKFLAIGFVGASEKFSLLTDIASAPYRAWRNDCQSKKWSWRFVMVL